MPITDALPNMKRELKFYPAKNDAPKKLTSDQIQQFNEKGYIFPLNVFTKKEAEANRAYFDKLMNKAQATGKNSYSINGWHRSCKGIYDLLVDNRILDYVEDLLGPQPRLAHDPLLQQNARRRQKSRLSSRRILLAPHTIQNRNRLARH